MTQSKAQFILLLSLLIFPKDYALATNCEQIPYRECVLTEGQELQTIDGVIDFLEYTHLFDWRQANEFVFLYIEMTKTVKSMTQAGDFHDKWFILDLDIEFAKIFFDRLISTSTEPKGWYQYLHNEDSCNRLVSAMKGMMLHINYDFGLALYEVQKRQGPLSESQHEDFLKVNDAILTTQDRVAKYFLGDLADSLLYKKLSKITVELITQLRNKALIDSRFMLLTGNTSRVTHLNDLLTLRINKKLNHFCELTNSLPLHP